MADSSEPQDPGKELRQSETEPQQSEQGKFCTFYFFLEAIYGYLLIVKTPIDGVAPRLWATLPFSEINGFKRSLRQFILD